MKFIECALLWCFVHKVPVQIGGSFGHLTPQLSLQGHLHAWLLKHGPHTCVHQGKFLLYTSILLGRIDPSEFKFHPLPFLLELAFNSNILPWVFKANIHYFDIHCAFYPLDKIVHQVYYLSGPLCWERSTSYDLCCYPAAAANPCVYQDCSNTGS